MTLSLSLPDNNGDNNEDVKKQWIPLTPKVEMRIATQQTPSELKTTTFELHFAVSDLANGTTVRWPNQI